jgi:RNA recognition motif-containing protein
MGTKIYVGGLPFSTSDSELTDLFAKYGTVTSAQVITDKFSGQSRGFAFVEMSTADEVAKAISGLNGTRLDSRTIVVNEAKPQEKRERSGGGSRW